MKNQMTANSNLIAISHHRPGPAQALFLFLKPLCRNKLLHFDHNRQPCCLLNDKDDLPAFPPPHRLWRLPQVADFILRQETETDWSKVAKNVPSAAHLTLVLRTSILHNINLLLSCCPQQRGEKNNTNSSSNNNINKPTQVDSFWQFCILCQWRWTDRSDGSRWRSPLIERKLQLHLMVYAHFSLTSCIIVLKLPARIYSLTLVAQAAIDSSSLGPSLNNITIAK